jgi:hypothetical protein
MRPDTGDRPVVASVILCHVLLSTCISLLQPAPVSAQSGHTFRVYTSEGIEVAENRGGPRYQEPLFDLEPLLTLVGSEDEPESLLWRPYNVAEGADGRFYVIDRGYVNIAVFDRKGGYVGRIGGRGSGPGELRSIIWCGFFQESLVLFDRLLQRMTRFTPDGSIIETVKPLVPVRADYVQRGLDGELVMVRNASGRDGEYITTQQILSVSTDGTGIQTEIAVPLRPQGVAGIDERTGAPAIFSLPFAGASSIRFMPGRGALLVDGYRDELEWKDLQGATILRIDLGIPDRPITRAERNSILDRHQRRMAEREPVDRDPTPVFPDRRGLWWHSIVDEDGYVWLSDAERITMKEEGDPYLYHLVSPDGEYLGTTSLPNPIFTQRNGRICMTVTDGTTGEWIPTVFRLVPRPSGFVFP